MSEYEIEEESEIYATLVEINREPVELYKILKFENMVAGGGEAKQLIADGYVYLNGEVETRKRKKIYAGDVIYFDGRYFQVALQGQTADYEVIEPEKEFVAEKQSKTKKARKAISF